VNRNYAATHSVLAERAPRRAGAMTQAGGALRNPGPRL